MAELWGSVVASLLFWGFANELTSVPEAKKYHPLLYSSSAPPRDAARATASTAHLTTRRPLFSRL